MSGEEVIINKVEKSGLVNLDLEQLLKSCNHKSIDLADFLFESIMLREKAFREDMEKHDWTQYTGQYVLIYCSEDAILPQWAWMLLSSKLVAAGAQVVYSAGPEDLDVLWVRLIRDLDAQAYLDKRVLVHGCAHRNMPNELFTAITEKLQPVVKSLMFGEACSNVPIFKRR